MDSLTTESPVENQIRCPRCSSTNWYCWDERTFDCWDKQGRHDGVRVVGYLGCKDCGKQWTDVSVDPGDDADCDCD